LDSRYHRSMRMRTILSVAAFCLMSSVPCKGAQHFDFPSAPSVDASALAKVMPALAMTVASSYHETDRKQYLDNLFRLQIVAGEYDRAAASLASLRRFKDATSPWSATNYSQFDIFVQAMRLQRTGIPFDEAFAKAFRTVVGSADDERSALIIRRFVLSTSQFQSDLRDALRQQQGKNKISLSGALALIRAYQLADMYQRFSSQARALIAADDKRRYIIEPDIIVKTPDGAHICTLVARPRVGAKLLPTLLQFTIYADRIPNLSDVRRTASNGFVGVTALTRGMGCSPDKAVPYLYDGSDGSAVIDWISRQPWSDGRVGMFGGSYNSFAQWAIAKHGPPALKALMPSVPNAPGIDTPMEANVFQSFSYEWPFYVLSSKWLDASSEGDPTHWTDLQNKWYVSGTSYRSIDKIDGRPNPIWDRWLDHPSYDAYWQQFIPYKEDFARIHLPALFTDGYLSGQDTGGLYYFSQYHEYSPNAESYLVIGPYDHIRGQRGTVSSTGQDIDAVAGFAIDPAAHIDIEELRYQWFDYVFKGAKKPAILQSRVNYEVMGANVWRHAPTIQAMHDEALTFNLIATKEGAHFGLTPARTASDAYVSQTVNFADRSDVNRIYSTTTALDTSVGVAYESATLKQPLDLAGLFAGHLDFVTNKKDLDFNISLYERTAKGEYLGVTYYQARASYVRDRSHRQLLRPGARTRLDFVSSRLASWRFHAGSRIVVLVSIVKEPDIQINYGTGNDVSDETVADAKIPLHVEWFGDSFVTIPAWK